MAASIITAFLYSLSFPFFSLWLLGFAALVPFLVVPAKNPPVWKRAALGFVLGAGLVLGTAHWLFYALIHEFEKPWTTGVLFVLGFALLPYGLLYSCFSVAFGYLKKRSLYFFCLVFPSLWVLTELLKQIIPIMIPWADLGYAALGGGYYVQVADLCGGVGVSFLLAMVNGTIAYLAMELFEQEKRSLTLWLTKNKAGIAVLALALGGPVLYGMARTAQIESPHEGRTVEAALVQASFSQKERWSGLGFVNRVRTYVKLSDFENAASPFVAVWPETVLNSSAMVNDDFFREVIQSTGPDALLITGGLRKTPDGHGTFNSAFFISGRGRVSAYDKHILLPYSENTPMGQDVLGDYYTAPSQFVPGVSPLAMETPMGKMGASICFEILYSGHVRRSVREGAQVLVNLSNDSWFNSTMPYMHLDAARMRAIENRRWLLRASNSGFSALIAPDGSIQARSELGARQAIRGGYSLSDEITPYTRFGPWILYLAGLIVASAVFTRKRT